MYAQPSTAAVINFGPHTVLMVLVKMLVGQLSPGVPPWFVVVQKEDGAPLDRIQDPSVVVNTSGDTSVGRELASLTTTEPL